MSNLFTYILEFNEGTFVKQVHGINSTDSTKIWLKDLLMDSEIEFINNQNYQTIYKELFDDNNFLPIQLKSVKNVWCFTFLIKESLALVNIIKTEQN
ncbi:MAG: hypothetical protein KDD24_01145 [Flavobacteriales bacterium]|nr:hypothetical protein [Flavobacteriales bacterium]MCB9173232.1 hypothetical protein [Flavobacteriales bacterium]